MANIDPLLPETSCHILFASPLLGIACIPIEIANHKSMDDENVISSISLFVTIGKDINKQIKELKKNGPVAIATVWIQFLVGSCKTYPDGFPSLN